MVSLCIGISVCTAQIIDIRGTVIDSSGAGINGATVELKESGISTNTGSDGSFTLSGNITAIEKALNIPPKRESSIRIQNGNLDILLFKSSSISVNIYNVSGRNIFSSSKVYSSGRHTLSFAAQTSGIHLYKVIIGNSETYSFKMLPFSSFSVYPENRTPGSSSFAKQARTAAVMRDVLCITKEGQLTYYDSIRTSDTSGIVVKMIPCAGIVVDVDGNEYQSVRLGDQVWTVENLRTTKYNDGTPIPYISDNEEWANSTSGAFCYYENDSANVVKHGALYNWYAVSTGNLAPEGWRIPSYTDWNNLQSYLRLNGYDFDGSTSGSKITKSMAARTDWIYCDTTGTPGNNPSSNNSSGFSAFPSGFRNNRSLDYGQGRTCYLWSATESGTSFANSIALYYDQVYLSTIGLLKQNGFPVRLVRTQ